MDRHVAVEFADRSVLMTQGVHKYGNSVINNGFNEY